MKENAFETIETFMADHLKDALDESVEYKEALSAANKARENLKTALTGEQTALLEQYFILADEASAICEKIAYRQGLRDLLKTLFAEEA
ncbi:MAG: hypothetical protein K2P42_12755 [Lachnospiraceae bacterium]|nr:hypothetical protein [Lachnospiraceae bacterium]MDE7002194.1 hypothetical protein [Lachnospiraceae bacterium]